MKNKDLIYLLSKNNPESEVKIVYEEIVSWNEDNTPKLSGYFQAFPYEVNCSNNEILIRITKEPNVNNINIR